MTIRALGLMAGASLLVLTACGQNRSEQRASEAQAGNPPAAGMAVTTAEPAADAAIAGNPDRNAYFGDVHVHTSLSFDAFTNGSRTTPKDAYDWAQGQTITSSGKGEPMRIRTPLDFYMVADHAEMLGVFRQMADPASPLSKLPVAREVLSPDANVAMQAFAQHPARHERREGRAGVHRPQGQRDELAGNDQGCRCRLQARPLHDVRGL